MDAKDQGQSEEVRAYLRYKMKGCDFEMCINPDEGYIPFCGVCRDAYEKYKVTGGETCEMEHSEACLWYAYFWSKIRDINLGVTVKRASARVAPTKEGKAPVRVPTKPPGKSK
jgi:hypothetical protein